MTDNNEQRRAALSRRSGTVTAKAPLVINSPSVTYTPEAIHSTYRYSSVSVSTKEGQLEAIPHETLYKFRTKRRSRRIGLLQVGWGGNNGTTVTAALEAHRHSITWETRNGKHSPNYNGSLTQASTLRVGFDESGRDVFVPLKNIIPMTSPDDIVLGGWDISGMNLADAVDRAGVLEPDLRNKLRPYIQDVVPMKGAFDPKFIAKNQYERADNVINESNKWKVVQQIRKDIRDFKERENVEYVVVVWTANSERYASEKDGMNDTADNLIKSLKDSHDEISPSTLYCVASVMEGCAYVNGSPQNTFVKGALELAKQCGGLICGDDFKSGQTKMKSVLADYLIGCGVKIRTMVTYNHLGNNDMYQLTDEVMWKPKSASKSRVIEDIVDSNGLLYGGNDEEGKGKDDKPDHVVVVKYVPFLGDSKRDVSEYTSETWMNCHYTTIMHNECLDSALCAPLILDLAILCELFSRVEYTVGDEEQGSGKDSTEKNDTKYEKMDSVMSIMGFYMKIPRVPEGEPIVNALGRQKACIENMLRALVGLPPENNMLLETKCPLSKIP